MTTAGLAATLRIRAIELEYDDDMPGTAALLREAADALERQSAAPAQGTVRVRIACAVHPDGSWHAMGGTALSDYTSPERMAKEGGTGYWITADLPLPAAQEIAGRVEGDDA